MATRSRDLRLAPALPPELHAGGADLRVVTGRGRGRGRDRGGADPLPRAARPGRRPTRPRRAGACGSASSPARTPTEAWRVAAASASPATGPARSRTRWPCGPATRTGTTSCSAGAAGPDPRLRDGEPDPYWLGPFQNYQTFCPYLVGSYDRVGAEVARYVDRGTTRVRARRPALGRGAGAHRDGRSPADGARTNGRTQPVASAEALASCCRTTSPVRRATPDATALVLGDEAHDVRRARGVREPARARSCRRTAASPATGCACSRRRPRATVAALHRGAEGGRRVRPGRQREPAAPGARASCGPPSPRCCSSTRPPPPLVDGLVEEGDRPTWPSAPLAEPLAGDRFASRSPRDDLASLPAQAPAAAEPPDARATSSSPRARPARRRA